MFVDTVSAGREREEKGREVRLMSSNAFLRRSTRKSSPLVRPEALPSEEEAHADELLRFVQLAHL